MTGVLLVALAGGLGSDRLSRRLPGVPTTGSPRRQGGLKLAAQSSRVIEKDARLSIPGSFWERSIDLDTLVKRASVMSGLALAVDPEIRHMRVILFEENQPLGQTLARVADCWDLAWARTDDGYRLYRTKEAAVAQGGFLAEARNDANALLDRQLEEWRKAPFVSPREGRRDEARLDEATKDLEASSALPKDRAARWTEFRDEKQALDHLLKAADPPVLALAKAMSPMDLGRLTAGDWVFGSTHPEPGFVRLPGTASDYDYSPMAFMTPQGDPYVGLRYDWSMRRLERWAPGLTPGDVGFELQILRPAICTRGKIWQFRLADRLRRWMTYEDADSWNPTGRTTFGRSTSSPAAETFEGIARNMHIPVVATDLYDAGGGHEDRASRDLYEAVRLPERSAPFWRHADGWLMARSDDYWRADAVAGLARLRRDVSLRLTTSAVDELSELARLRTAVPDDLGPLLDFQASRLPVPEWTKHVRDEPEARLLRLWLLLSEPQQRQALGEGLPWSDLNRRQREQVYALALPTWFVRPRWMEASRDPLAGPLVWDAADARLQVMAHVQPTVSHSVGGGGTSWCVDAPQLPDYPEWIPRDLLHLDPDAEISAYAEWLYEFCVEVGGKAIQWGYAVSDVPIWKGKVRELGPITKRLEGLFDPYWKAEEPLARERTRQANAARLKAGAPAKPHR